MNKKIDALRDQLATLREQASRESELLSLVKSSVVDKLVMIDFPRVISDARKLSVMLAPYSRAKTLAVIQILTQLEMLQQRLKRTIKVWESLSQQNIKRREMIINDQIKREHLKR